MSEAAISVGMTDEFAQRGRWRAFGDSFAEESYQIWHRERVLPVARIASAASALAWIFVPLLFRLSFGAAPRELFIGAWAVAVPCLLGLSLAPASLTRRWISELSMVVITVVGLDFVWVMSVLYGPASGTVTCGVFATIFYPLIIRLSTARTVLVTAALTAVPVALMANGIRHGQVSLADSWPYIVVLLVNAPIVVVSAALIESGVRAQFKAEKTVIRQRSQLEASQRLLRRYVPQQVADAVLSNRSDAIGRHERRKLTVFFSDLVGFTDLSDEMEPEDLATVLHDYFTEMSAIAQRHGGTVDDLIGDAVLVLFGAPDFTDDRDQALRAVRMALEMQQAMGPLNQRWASAGIPEALAVRMGINTGVATVGNFGSAERTKYTALGKQVNIAARIQSKCEPGRVLLGHATWLLVRDEIVCIPKGEYELKGLRKAMPTYEASGLGLPLRSKS
jgi:class 3 adenylate cyclase